MDEQKPFQESEAGDRVIWGRMGLESLVASDSHSNMGFLDHGYIIGSVPDCQGNVLFQELLGDFYNLRLLLGWRPTAEHCLCLNSLVKEGDFNALVTQHMSEHFMVNHYRKGSSSLDCLNSVLNVLLLLSLFISFSCWRYIVLVVYSQKTLQWSYEISTRWDPSNMPQDCPICKAVSSLSPVSTHILILASDRLFKVSCTPYFRFGLHLGVCLRWLRLRRRWVLPLASPWWLVSSQHWARLLAQVFQVKGGNSDIISLTSLYSLVLSTLWPNTRVLSPSLAYSSTFLWISSRGY